MTKLLLNAFFWTGTTLAVLANVLVLALILYAAAVRWFVGVVG